MIVWGGDFNNGGRYNPVADSWTAVRTNGAPSARSSHTAVWTGSEMIVWGGANGTNYVGDTWSYYPTKPALRISLTDPGSATVAWPVWSTTFTLRQNADLGLSNWTAVTNPVSVLGAENRVTLSPLRGGWFFRLSYP